MNKNVGILVLAMLLVACQQATDTPVPKAASVDPVSHPGEAAYLEHCASCHDQPIYKAPSRLFIGAMGARNVLAAMNGGPMSGQAAELEDASRKAIAEYLYSKRKAVELSAPNDERLNIVVKLTKAAE